MNNKKFIRCAAVISAIWAAMMLTDVSCFAAATSRSVEAAREAAEAAGHMNGEDTAVSEDNSNAFTARIQRILDEHHREAAAARRHVSRQPVAPPPNLALPSADNESAAVQHEEAVYEEADEQHEEQVSQDAQDMQLPSGLYDFDWQGTPIAQSLYAVAKIAGKDVVVNGELKGNVFISLHGKTCEQAMDYLARSFNFNWMTDENAIIVSTSELMRQSATFSVHHVADMDKLTEEIKALGFDSERVYANTESRTISVTGTPYLIEQAKRRLNVIDKPVSQCLIVAQLIEISHGKNVNLGFQYSLPTYSHAGTTTGKTTDDSFRGNWLEKLTFSASATASKELSKGKVISRPMIMVLNGQEGSVNFGDQVPVMTSTSTTASTEITVDYKDVGTKLAITPAIDEASGEITMKINAEVSNISKWVTTGRTSAPQIATRRATTSAHLRSGQSFVIGGLMSVAELDNLSGIPGLMDLPILGALFRYHSKSKSYAEIYIMLTPYIVTDDIDPSALLRRAGGGNNGSN